MISIVTPTMWKYPPYLDFLKYIVKLDVIKEVIIINNDSSKTPADPILAHPKVRMLSFGRNIFINPAWNIGVSASESDIVCILNDDIHFDLRLFYKVDEFFKPDMGAIGLSSGIVAYGQKPITTGMIEFDPFTGQNCEGFGELMFVRKKRWRDIPEGLYLGYGDNFIFDYHHFLGYQNYFISNMFHYHAGNSTIGTFPSNDRQDLYIKETEIYNRVKAGMIDKTFYLTGNRN